MASRLGPAAVAGAFFSLAAGVAHATPQVVGDEACARYAVDIAAFATCEDGRVVRPDDAEAAAGARAAGAGPSAWIAVPAPAASPLARTLLAQAAVAAAPAPERACAPADPQPR
ncbi:MAG: hypothetical protein U1F10_09420 [Burkholderiales bacterium]